VDDVYKRLKAEEYETVDVCMSCTMPIGMLTRDTLLRFHANEILKQQGQEAIINEWKEIAVRDPKDFFKYLFGLKWKEVTGLGEIKGEAPLRMTVVINHEPSAKEHMFLSQVKEPTLRVRTIRQKKVKVVVGDSRWCITEALKKVDPTEARE
jgi:tRNA pseudouridine synthase 10